MSFLLFAARKMQLKREINANNFEQIKVQDQLKAAQKRVSIFQDQMSQMKNMTSVMARALQAKATQTGYAQALNVNEDFMNRWANGQLTDKEKEQVQNAQASLSQVQTGATAVASAFSTVTDSIFTAVSNVQLEVLKAESDRLDNKLTSLKTEGQLLSTEYSEYDQAISSAVKEAAPKFGLA